MFVQSEHHELKWKEARIMHAVVPNYEYVSHRSNVSFGAVIIIEWSDMVGHDNLWWFEKRFQAANADCE